MRIGVIGCGDIAQVMHIPYLIELPDVDVRAVVDATPSRASGIAGKYNIPHHYTDTETLFSELTTELDGVVIATPVDQHAAPAVTALNTGLSTFIEKPLAVSLEEAEAVLTAAEESQGVAMVGYNKRYDASFALFQEEVSAMGSVDLVSVYDVDPDHWRIFHEVYDTVGDSVPDELRARSERLQQTAAKETIGTHDDELAAAFRFHLEHACHDVNALRALFGPVTSINHVDVYADGRYATFIIEYGGIRCTIHSGRSDRKWFEQTIRVDSPDGMAAVEFDNPFIRNASTTLQIKTGVEEYTERTEIPSYEESFKRELEAFVRAHKRDTEPRTTVSEARADLRLFADLFRTYCGAERLRSYQG
jgi:predicted dehydrogenase